MVSNFMKTFFSRITTFKKMFPENFSAIFFANQFDFQVKTIKIIPHRTINQMLLLGQDLD